MTLVCFSEPWGFVADKADQRQLLHTWRNGLFAISFLTRFRWLRDRVSRAWWGVYLLPSPEDKVGMGYIIGQANKQVTERERRIEDEGYSQEYPDFMQFCLEARINGQPLTPSQKRAHISLLIVAGSNTTGTAMGSILRYFMKYPAVLARVRAEIAAAERAGRLSTPIQYEETRENLPFFVACMKETIRLQPSAAQLFGRVAPAGGTIVEGVWVPPGTDMTAVSYAVQRDPALYAPDPEVYRPERWLEGEVGGNTKEVISEMEAANFGFGVGSRVCLGQDVARFEIYKMVPEFVRRFDFEMKEERRFKLSPELQGVAVDGMLFGESASPLKLSQCSSGTCSFDEVAGVTHSSAGFCSQCTDATAALRESVVAGSDATAYHFGDMAGFNLTWPPADGRLFNMLSGDSFASARASSSVLAFRPSRCPQNQANTSEDDWRTCMYRAFTSDHGRYARVGQEVNILAVNCTLSPCVRHLSATIINGSLEETLVFEQENTNWTFQWEGGKRTFGGYTTMIEPCVVNGTWYDRYNISEATRGDTNSWTSWGLAPDSVDSREAPTECVRAIGADMMDGLQTFLSSTLAGGCVVESGSAPDLGRGGFVPEGGQKKQQLHFSCGDKWLLDRLYDQGRVTFETVARAYDSMATAINNRLRGDIKPEYGEVLFAKGSVFGPAQCVHARWLWLTYPGVSLLLAAVILVAAYVQSCRERAGQPIWKSTVLPLLFYNVHTAAEGRESEAVTSALAMRELRALADKTQARFDADVGFVVRTSG